MSKRQKRNLYRILVGAVLFAAAWLIPAEGWLHLVLFLIPYAILAWDVIYGAGRNILRGQVFDENFLMSVASIGAFLLGEFPEAVAVMLFYQVGELFQSVAVGKSRRSIAALMDIRPDHAVVLRQGTETRVSPEEVAPGETILVRPGEKIPLDGILLSGGTSVNTAALTGESLPRDVLQGENVVSGTVNLSAPIQVRVTSPYGESTVSKILSLMENSASKKAKTENFITRFARVYTPCVVAGAVLIAVLPPLISGYGWGEWIRRALIFLVVSCPCALVISVPLSFFGGIGGASKKGILIKGSNYLEALSRVKTVVFDKTGTLTQGSFSVTGVYPQGISQSALMELAALAESRSNHPIAQSILRSYGLMPDMRRLSDVEELPGLGIRGVIDGQTVYAGNGKLMDQAGVLWHGTRQPGTAVHIAMGKEYCGHIVIADRIKDGAAQAIEELKASGVEKTVMLTGDDKRVAAAVGAELKIDQIHGGLLPEDKVAIVEQLILRQAPGQTLAFVGDGINDAPVLARADVGVAMGALGSDAAIEAADVVLMDDQPEKVAAAVYLSRATMAIVKQNIVFALSVKGAVLLLGAMGIAGMWFAVFADVGVSVIAILNAMRALRA